MTKPIVSGSADAIAKPVHRGHNIAQATTANAALECLPIASQTESCNTIEKIMMHPTAIRRPDFTSTHLTANFEIRVITLKLEENTGMIYYCCYFISSKRNKKRGVATESVFILLAA